jgi:hypothetical protein
MDGYNVKDLQGDVRAEFILRKWALDNVRE